MRRDVWVALSTSAPSVTGNTLPSRVIANMRRPSMGQMPLKEKKCLSALTAASSTTSRSPCGSMLQCAVRIPTGRVHSTARWKAVSQGTTHSLISRTSMPTCHTVMGGKNDDNKLHQDYLSCKGIGHLDGCLGGHIAIFTVYFGGRLAIFHSLFWWSPGWSPRWLCCYILYVFYWSPQQSHFYHLSILLVFKREIKKS